MLIFLILMQLLTNKVVNVLYCPENKFNIFWIKYDKYNKYLAYHNYEQCVTPNMVFSVLILNIKIAYQGLGVCDIMDEGTLIIIRRKNISYKIEG